MDNMIKYKKAFLCLALLIIVLSMGTVSAHLSEQPAVNIETPIHNTEVSGEVEIVATVEDHYTTEHVNFTIEGLDDSNKDYQTAYQDTDSSDGWKYTWDTTNVSDGRYYVQAKALSSNGLKGGYNILLNVANEKIIDNSTPETPDVTPSESNSSSNTTSDSGYNFTQIYGTYLGGDGEDKAKGVFTDAKGNIYIVMETNSNDLNTTEGVFQANKSGGKDIYVAKFDKSGEIVFATFIGGSSTEFEKDFKVDAEGNIYITGLTASPNFPTTDNAIIKNLSGSQSAYLAVLSADGKKLKYSTYLGGSKVDRGWALVIDDKGNAFVQGITNSIDFPVTENAYQKDKDGIDWNENTSSDDIDFQNSFDLFVSEINTNTGELVYSTYFGGRGADSTYGSLAVKDNVIYFAGTTDSIDFPTTPNANRTVRNVGEADSFVAAIDISNSTLLYSSYIGGNKTDDGEALIISDDGFLYYVGDTWSPDFPTTATAYQRTYGGVGDSLSGGDIFAMKFDTSDWSIVYSTYIGGNADEGGRAIALDKNGNLIIGGMSQSSDYPVTDDAYQKEKNGPAYKPDPQQHADYYTVDAVLAVLNPEGSELVYSTFYGGQYGEFIMGMNLFDGGIILQLRTYSDDLWVSDNAYQKEKANDTYNPSIPYIGTQWEDYYANRTIFDMDTYFGVFLFNDNTTLTVSNATVGINQNANIILNLTSVNRGAPIADREIKVTIGKEEYTVVTNSEGIAKVTTFSSPEYGVFSVVASFEGDEIYGASEAEAIVNVTESSLLPMYATYLGGNGEDKAKGVYTDDEGNIYIVMETNSNDLNTTEGVFQANKSGGKDIYVAKFDANGELVFATFIGGSSTEFEKDFKVDAEGNIYITGLTASPNFPTTDNALIKNLSGSQSAYLAVLSADGKTLKYSTYLGGSKVDRGWALVIDDEGHAFVQGITNSIDFPVTDNAYQKDKDGIDWNENTSSDDIDFQNSFDIFISEIDTNSGELVYSTYFGGRGADSTYGSLTVKDDIVYFAGTTTSIDFPTTPNANRTVRNVGEADSFIAAINITNNTLLYSSYIGGSKTDDGEALIISDDGFLYYVGDTWSDDFPTTANAYQKTYGGVGDSLSGGDIFAMKFDTSDWSIVYSTYIGGNADEGGRAIALDEDGNLIIGGMSQSSDYPVTDDAFQKVKNGPVYKYDPQQHADYYTVDAVLAVLNPEGSDLLYSTYIGGQYGEFIMGMTLIDGGIILQYRTYSDDLWVSENAYQKVKGDDLYNPSIPYIGTQYEDYYANRTIYDMDTYFAVYMFSARPTALTNLVPEYTSVPTIQAGVENTLTLTVTNDKFGNDADVTVKVICDNETLFEQEITNYTKDSYEFVFVDPTIRPIDETTVNGANNTKAVYTVIVETNGTKINTTDYSFPVLYNGNLGKDYEYPTVENTEIVREYEITGDVVIAVSDDSAYMATGATTRNETLTAEFDGEVADALLYIAYNWDGVETGDFNTWNVTFNDVAITPIASYRDQGNLGNYGKKGYGLVVYNVAELVKSGDNNVTLSKVAKNSAVYPSSLVVLTNANETANVKSVYIAENADLLANSYSKNLTVGAKTLFENVDPNAVVNATLYVFAASGQKGEGNIIFNDNVSSDVWSGSSNSANLFEMDVTDILEQTNELFFEATGSTIVALHQIIVVESEDHIVLDVPEVEKYYKGPERLVVYVTDNRGNVLANQSVNITINGVTYTRTSDENGTASMALGLNSGEYDVTASAGNSTFESKVTILPTVFGDDIVKVFRNGTQYYATFLDSEGNYLANGTEVTFNINGVMYKRYINGSEGKARLNINLPQGEYVITAINPVNGEMAANNITVLPSITNNENLVKYYKNDSQYYVTIIGDDGNPVGENVTVKFNINGVFYERKTNASGVARLNINLEPGEYIITAEYNDCRVSNNITVLPVLNATNLTKKYGTADPFVATLVDGTGAPYAGQNVTFNINGVFYQRTTDDSGNAKLNINLMAGEYIITSSYNGANIANKVTVTA